MVSYLTKKILTLLYLRQLAHHEKKPGIFVLRNYHKGEVIGFHLNNPQYMHPGDHLFFEPLIRFLKESGLPVIVSPTRLMKPYFINQGYTVSDDVSAAKFVISKPEMRHEVKNVGVFIHTACPRIPTRLCHYLVDSFSELYDLPISENFSKKPRPYSGPCSIDLTPFATGSFALFNNYVDSGSFRLTQKKRQRLFAAAKQSKYTLIHVGSQKDKDQDSKFYDFITHDLRGKTTLMDLFCLSAHPNIHEAITFDNVIMHIMSLQEKKSRIVFRGRFTKSARDFHARAINPAFESTHSLVELI